MYPPCLGVWISPSGELEILNASVGFLLGTEDPVCLFQKCPLAGWGRASLPVFLCSRLRQSQGEKSGLTFHGIHGVLGPTQLPWVHTYLSTPHQGHSFKPPVAKQQRPSSQNRMNFPPR